MSPITGIDFTFLLHFLSLQLGRKLRSPQINSTLLVTHDDDMEMIFSCVAIAFLCLRKASRPLTLHTVKKMHNTLHLFQRFMSSEHTRIVSMLQQYRKKHASVIVAPKAIRAIAATLEELITGKNLEPDLVVSVSQLLCKLCEDVPQDSEVSGKLQKAITACKKVLDQVRAPAPAEPYLRIHVQSISRISVDTAPLSPSHHRRQVAMIKYNESRLCMGLWAEPSSMQ